MAESIQRPGDSGTDTPALSRDELFEVLGNDRRRYVLEAVLDADGTLATDTVVDRVAAAEFGKAEERVTSEERKLVRTALTQTHLPKLEDEGMIRHDREGGVVEPAGNLEEVDLYLEIVEGRTVPFHRLYLLLALLGGVAFGAAVAGIPAVASLSPTTWLSLLVGCLGISALVHLHHMERIKLESTAFVGQTAHKGGGEGASAPLVADVAAAVTGGLVGGAGMWIILHEVMFLSPLIVGAYGLPKLAWAGPVHAGHSVLAALLFGLALRRPSIRAIARSATGTVSLGALYGVGLWVVVEGLLVPRVVPISAASMLSIAGVDLLYLPIEGLAAHVVFGSLLGAAYTVTRRYVTGGN